MMDPGEVGSWMRIEKYQQKSILLFLGEIELRQSRVALAKNVEMRPPLSIGT